jgi:hypothetical protein
MAAIAQKITSRAGITSLAEVLEGCRHVPSKATLGRVNEHVLAFLAGPKETKSGR